MKFLQTILGGVLIASVGAFVARTPCHTFRGAAGTVGSGRIDQSQLCSKESSPTRLFVASTPRDGIFRDLEDSKGISFLSDLFKPKDTAVKQVQVENAPFTESTTRSATKAICWRLIAGSVTFVTSLQISGSLQVAFSLVSSDFFTKALTMFIGERLMNKSQAGRSDGSDGVGRSLAKALIWRLFAIVNTLTMAVLISKDLSVASKIAGSDAIVKTGLMFLYERSWAKIHWGKVYSPAGKGQVALQANN